MNIRKYLSVIIFASTLWTSINFKSPAQAFDLVNFAQTQLRKIQTLSQNPAIEPVDSAGSKDLTVKNMTITRNTSDKSLLNLEGQINNQSGQSHYVYYIVAKFVSKDTSIKQAIIPVNIKLEPSQSALFTHEISTESLNSIAPEAVKPVIVKYEYR